MKKLISNLDLIKCNIFVLGVISLAVFGFWDVFAEEDLPEITITTDKETYNVRDSINMTLHNTGNISVSSCADWCILIKHVNLDFYPKHFGGIQATNYLEPGEKQNWPFELRHDLIPGKYQLSIKYNVKGSDFIYTSHFVEVKCKDSLEFIQKISDGRSSCVKPDSIEKLIERGWASGYLMVEDNFSPEENAFIERGWAKTN